jgi:hypothetical protein
MSNQFLHVHSSSTAILERPTNLATSTYTPICTQTFTFTPQAYTYAIITDKDEAKIVWEKFANPNVLFENWDFLMTFYNEFRHSLQFYVGYAHGQAVGLIPLNFDDDTGKLESFFSKKAQHPIFVKPGYEDIAEFLLNKIE